LGWSGTLCNMPQIGATAERTKKIVRRDIELFTELTGDHNPLHYDEKLAKASMFEGIVVQGGVTSGILNALVAEQIPGPGTVFLGLDLKFSRGVYVGDVITGELVVKEVREDKPICKLDVTVRNQ